MDDANFASMDPEGIMIYFTLTKRVEAPPIEKSDSADLRTAQTESDVEMSFVQEGQLEKSVA